jgi:hypothetical protein
MDVAYLRKPFPMAVLVKRVDELLTERAGGWRANAGLAA